MKTQFSIETLVKKKKYLINQKMLAVLIMLRLLYLNNLTNNSFFLPCTLSELFV